MFIIDRSWIEKSNFKKTLRGTSKVGEKGKKEKNLRAKTKKKKRKEKKKIPKKEISTWVNLTKQTHEKLTNTYDRLFLIYNVIK